MKPLRIFLRTLRQTIDKMAPRERALSALFFFLACLSTALTASDWAEAAETSAISAAERVIQWKEAYRKASDPSKAVSLRKLASQLRSVSFVASTTSIARAEAQAVVRTAAADAGIDDAAVTLDAAAEAVEGVAVQSLTVEGRFTWPSFIRLVERISRSRQIFLVKDVTVVSGRTPRFRLLLITSLAGAQP